jgi:AraC-like DNA-binding protein
MQNYQKYLNVSNTEKSWEFYVNTVGSAKVGANESYPNNREHPLDHALTWNKGRILNGYYIVFITKGEGVLESAKTKPVEISAGTCFLLFPGIWHRYKPNPASGWEEYWVGFNGEYPDMLIRKGIFKPEDPFINVGLNEDLLLLFHTLIKVTKAAEIGHRQVATGITLQMLGLLNSLAKYHDHIASRNGRLVAKAKFLLQNSIENPVSLERIAEEIPMGYSNFRKIFKQVTGMSPNQYLLELKLDKARELLNATNLTVNEVSYQTGFDSVFYFSRIFKKKNGVAPKEYRNQLK